MSRELRLPRQGVDEPGPPRVFSGLLSRSSSVRVGLTRFLAPRDEATVSSPQHLASLRPSPSSPCIGECRLDEEGVTCTGCRRTLTEIRLWGQMDDEGRWAVLRRLAQEEAAAEAR